MNSHPTEQMSYYLPGYEPTETYIQGMRFLEEDRLTEAAKALENEPIDSQCYGLALANSGLACLRLEQFQLAEAQSSKALEVFSRIGCPHPPSWVQCARNLAESACFQNRRHEAISLHKGALKIGEELAGKYPAYEKVIQQELGHILNSSGGVCLNLDLFSEAVEYLRQALEKYRQYSAEDPTGLAETLTNYGIALSKIDRKTDAHFAFQEAISVSKRTNNSLQAARAEVAMVQMDFSLVENPLEVLDRAIHEAKESGFFSTAFIRCGIKSDIATDLHDYKVALAAVEEAILLEPKLDRGDTGPAKLRITHAQLLLENNHSKEDAVKTLISGATFWFDHLRTGLISADFRTVTTEMHLLFRYLTHLLITLSRYDEATVAFEAGRALAHTIEVDPEKGANILEQCPFDSVTGEIDCSILTKQRATLRDEQIFISIAILFSKLVAFIICKERVDVVKHPIPNGNIGLKNFLECIEELPSRLNGKLGKAAIPATLAVFSSKIAGAVGTGIVVGVFPTHVLHIVPWRSILRDVGLDWKQLLFSTEFGLLIHDGRRDVTISSCTALGYGSAGSTDLVQEARDFAKTFGQRGIIIEPCTEKAVRNALETAEAVVVSCHGVMSDSTYSKTHLKLSLAGGDFSADDVFPEKVNARLVVLSACNSGVYLVSWGDYPIGAAPSLIRAGAKYCIGARFPVGARFAADYMKEFSANLSNNQSVPIAFVESLEIMEARGADFWEDIACFELLAGG